MNPQLFRTVCLQVFRHQYACNQVYRQWVDAMGVVANNVEAIEDIPFLPISFFKNHKVVAGAFTPGAVFTSSGTSQTTNSRHYVKDTSLYVQSFSRGFQMFYGDVKQWCIIGLLPGYLERSGSSLVNMVEHLVQQSGHAASGFYLYNFDKLATTLSMLEAAGQPTLLIGVTFALLDFATQYPMQLKHTVVMETGGMKGRRREMIRAEVHETLCNHFGLPVIHSEYGMTELLSQAYSKGNGMFEPVPWLKVLVREEDDPLQVSASGRGVLNVIDLANLHSCSFIATDDVGTVWPNGSFEVLGRMDASDIRGCSLLAV